MINNHMDRQKQIYPDHITILVVDDEKSIRDLLCEAIECDGYRCLTAGDGKEALTVLEDERVDVVITDIMMPQMDGWELLQSLKLDSQVRNIPIIVCSAWDDPDLSRTLGAAAFLKKPITQKMLLDAITRLLPPE